MSIQSSNAVAINNESYIKLYCKKYLRSAPVAHLPH
jgi:hypothetical protein